MTADQQDAAVVVSGLTKTFGASRALDGVDLAVPEGAVFGFLGPNGAGKTTTLRILAGLARPTSGSASVFGHDVTRDADSVHALIGYLPDVPGFYKWMTATEYLELSGRLFGLEPAVLEQRSHALLDLAGLTGVTTRIGGYSRGMKQRLGVAQALINAPRLLLLDEPTSALDPIGRREVLEMIASLAGRTTVFFSTHILADVERVCSDVAILARGRVVAAGRHRRAQGAPRRRSPGGDRGRRPGRRWRRSSPRQPGRHGRARGPRAHRRGQRPGRSPPRGSRPWSPASASRSVGSRPTRSLSRTSSSISWRGRRHDRLLRLCAQGGAGDAQDVAPLGAPRRPGLSRPDDADTRRRHPRDPQDDGGAHARGRHPLSGPDGDGLLRPVHGQPRPAGPSRGDHHRGVARRRRAPRRDGGARPHQAALALRLHLRQGAREPRGPDPGHRARRRACASS